LIEAEALFKQFHEMTTGKEDSVDQEVIGKLGVLAGVREYPARVKTCNISLAYSRCGFKE